jgi:hypothetical protein
MDLLAEVLVGCGEPETERHNCLFYWLTGAGDGIRTRDIDLGKVALYQLSYSRPSQVTTILPALGGIVK